MHFVVKKIFRNAGDENKKRIRQRKTKQKECFLSSSVT